MANIVYIFGAGASQAIHPSVPGMQMANQLGAAMPWKDWVGIKNFLRSGGAPFYMDSDNLQSLLGDDPRVGNVEQMLVAFEDYSASSDERISNSAEWSYEMIRQALADIFSQLDASLGAALEASPYDLFAREMVPYLKTHKHTFISFNYDMWLERSLQKHGSWNPARGYSKKYSLGVRGPQGFRQLREDRLSPTIVYKPHGSLSILTPLEQPFELQYPIINVDDADMDEPGSKGRLAYLPVGTKSVNFRVPTHPPREYRPFIIPPLRNKSIGGPFLLDVYEGIEEALAEAAIIVIVGWSMPETDSVMRHRFLNAVRSTWKPGAAQRLIICNINKTNLFYQRFQAAIPAKSVTICKDGFGANFIENVLKPAWREEPEASAILRSGGRF